MVTLVIMTMMRAMSMMPVQWTETSDIHLRHKPQSSSWSSWTWMTRCTWSVCVGSQNTKVIMSFMVDTNKQTNTNSYPKHVWKLNHASNQKMQTTQHAYSSQVITPIHRLQVLVLENDQWSIDAAHDELEFVVIVEIVRQNCILQHCALIFKVECRSIGECRLTKVVTHHHFHLCKWSHRFLQNVLCLVLLELFGGGSRFSPVHVRFPSEFFFYVDIENLIVPIELVRTRESDGRQKQYCTEWKLIQQQSTVSTASESEHEWSNE